jgi:phosphoribosyl-ATP pyrophosphohydrolase/phosphoribosyl-AMP cyclohydrolase
MAMAFIQELENIIEERKRNLPPGSYTTKLFQGGIDRILKKIGEEAGEVIIAAKNDDIEELKNECADLLYHLLIVLHQKNLTFTDVEKILELRHTQKSQQES